MIEIQIRQDQRDFADQLRKDVNEARAKNLKTCFNCKDPEKERFIGWLGEVVLKDALGLARPRVEAFGDQGHDLILNGRRINLKTTDFFGQRLKLMVRAGYDHKVADYYLLSVLNRDHTRLMVIGYISTMSFMEKKQVGNFGYFDTEYLPCIELTTISDLAELRALP